MKKGRNEERGTEGGRLTQLTILQVEEVLGVHALEPGSVADDEALHHAVVGAARRRHLKGELPIVVVAARRVNVALSAVSLAEVSRPVAAAASREQTPRPGTAALPVAVDVVVVVVVVVVVGPRPPPRKVTLLLVRDRGVIVFVAALERLKNNNKVEKLKNEE